MEYVEWGQCNVGLWHIATLRGNAALRSHSKRSPLSTALPGFMWGLPSGDGQQPQGLAVPQNLVGQGMQGRFGIPGLELCDDRHTLPPVFLIAWPPMLGHCSIRRFLAICTNPSMSNVSPKATVRFRGQSGHLMLRSSFSAYDPNATSRQLARRPHDAIPSSEGAVHDACASENHPRPWNLGSRI